MERIRRIKSLDELRWHQGLPILMVSEVLENTVYGRLKGIEQHWIAVENAVQFPFVMRINENDTSKQLRFLREYCDVRYRKEEQRIHMHSYQVYKIDGLQDE